jgi:hypothetical protein
MKSFVVAVVLTALVATTVVIVLCNPLRTTMVEPVKVVVTPSPVCKLLADLETDPHVKKAITDDLIEIESNCPKSKGE